MTMRGDGRTGRATAAVQHFAARLQRTLRRSLRRTAPVPCTAAATDTRPGDDVDPPGEQIEDEWFRLLVLVPWLTIGGSDKFNLDLIAQLTSLGWQVSVASTRQGDTRWLPAVHSAHARCVRPATLSATGRLSAISALSDRIARNRRRHDRELGAWLSSCCRTCRRHAPRRRLRRLLSHGGGRLAGRRLSAPVDRCRRRCSIVSIVLSEHLRRWMMERGRAAGDVIVSHNGVRIPPASVIAAERSQYRAAWRAGELPVVTFAGRAGGSEAAATLCRRGAAACRARRPFHGRGRRRWPRAAGSSRSHCSARPC